MPSVAPPTAYPPGTKLTVGSHEVVIKKYISEGGFAHVYAVATDPPLPGEDVACLKRVAVPNKTYLNLLRAEVEAMQRLQDSPNVVHYIDSHAERMRDGGTGYEVFLLMEFCGGSLIDFMNTRLRDQLREFEVLKIMYDISLGVAQMHYLQPPLIHRDLKIENVLIADNGNTYKLCDFGSASPPLRVPKTPGEYRILEDDIQHHTTLQYRSPEMVDLKRNQPIDEKSDIWALGVFLYKLCYYTTPFERPNQTMEQLNAQIASGVFTIPSRPAYSDRLKNMIRVLLQVNPAARPNIYQVLEEVSAMRNVECPIPNIYHRPIPQAVPVPVPGQIPGPPQLPNQLPNQVPNQVPVPQLVPGVPAPQLLVSLPGQTSAQPVATHEWYDRQQARVAGPRPLQLADEPPSPMSRAISPGAEDDVASRFPSLEELNIGLPPKPPKHARPPQSQPLPAAPQSQPLQPPQPQKPEFPMPQRPPRPNKPESLTVPTTPVTDSNSEEDSSPERPTRKLSKILTDIGERSSTVIMQANDRQNELSSVDFLRSLDHEHTGSRMGHSRPTSAHGHRHKPSLSAFFGRRSSGHSAKSAGSAGSDNDDDDESFVPHLQRRPVTYSTEDQAAEDLRPSSSYSRYARPSTERRSMDRPAPERVERPTERRSMDRPERRSMDRPAERRSIDKPAERKSLDRERKSLDRERKPLERPAEPERRSLEQPATADSEISSPTSSEDESPPLVDLGDGDADSSVEFRPSNVIQQRVKAFLSEAVQDQQKPMRTARGYGKFVDEQVRNDTGTKPQPKHAGLGTSKSTPTLATKPHHQRPKSVIVAKPATPAKPAKSKLQRVHSDESFETVGRGRNTPPPKPKSPKPVLPSTQPMKPLKPVPARTTRLRSE